MLGRKLEMKNNITNIPLLRKNNINNILKIVWDKKIITRKKLSEITSLAAPTISSITNVLSKKGIIKFKGKGISSGGRQPDLIEFNPNAYYVIGISLKVYKVKALITNLYGKKVKEFEIKADYSGEHANIIPQIEIIMSNLLRDFDAIDDLVGIGVSFPGTVNNINGIVLDSPIIGNGIGVNIKKYLENNYNLPTFVDNNANLCAFNEYWFGKGKNKRYLLFIFAGYGIGCGLIIDGEIYTGYKDAAGEIGHTVVEKNGEKCYCGSSGCLETIASYPSLFKKFKEKVKMSESTIFSEIINKNFSVQEVEKIFDYANKGEILPKSVLNEISQYLGIAIANLLNILNPEIVILGGDYYMVKDIIMNPIIKATKSRSRLTVRDTEIVFTDFGLDACVYGAATYAILNFIENSHKYI